MKVVIELSKGNPGAVNALMQLRLSGHPGSIDILEKIQEIPTLRGTNIYVLFSDICGNDVDKVHTLCENCPSDILEDACSRQDYSGRQLVSKYFMKRTK